MSRVKDLPSGSLADRFPSFVFGELRMFRRLSIPFFTLLIATAIFAVPHGAHAAPLCDSDAEGTYIDGLRQSADAASEAGKHRLAMTLLGRAADYAARCAPIDTDRTRDRAAKAGNNYDPSNAFFSPAMILYVDAAKEAKLARLRAEACMYAKRSMQMQAHTDARGERPDNEMRRLLSSC